MKFFEKYVGGFYYIDAVNKRANHFLEGGILYFSQGSPFPHFGFPGVLCP